MSLHQTIKEQIKDALRARDTIRLDALRGLNALALNELIASKISDDGTPPAGGGEFLSDDRMIALVKRSAKQRKDSIEQFEKGGREDLAINERAELKILEAFQPAMMSRSEIKIIARTRIDALKSQGALDPKAGASAGGRITGMLMKELAGKADGTDVKAVVDDLLTK
jgi:uncharacterized protein YqeY